MPFITRRQALSRIGIASSAAIAAGGVSLNVSEAAKAHLDAELLAIGHQLAVAEQAFHDAVEAEAAAFERWQAKRPHPHESILYQNRFFILGVDNWAVRDPRGDAVRAEDGQPLYVATPEGIRVALAASDGRTWQAKWLRRMLPHAERFWCDLETAGEVSGAFAAEFAGRRTWYDLKRLSKAAFERPAASLEGLAVQARSAVLDDLGRSVCGCGHTDQRLVALAASLNQIVGRQA